MACSGPNRFQKYARSGGVRSFLVNLLRYGSLSPLRTSICRTRDTLQMSVPTRNACGNGRSGMEFLTNAVVL
jgi:hypothetical protein